MRNLPTRNLEDENQYWHLMEKLLREHDAMKGIGVDHINKILTEHRPKALSPIEERVVKKI